MCIGARSQATQICQQRLMRTVRSAIRAWHEQTQTEKMNVELHDSLLQQAFKRWHVLTVRHSSARAAATVMFARAGRVHLSKV